MNARWKLDMSTHNYDNSDKPIHILTLHSVSDEYITLPHRNEKDIINTHSTSQLILTLLDMTDSHTNTWTDIYIYNGVNDMHACWELVVSTCNYDTTDQSCHI